MNVWGLARAGPAHKPLSPAPLLLTHLPQPWGLHSCSSLTPQTWCPLLTVPFVSWSCSPQKLCLHLDSMPGKPEQPSFESSGPLSQCSKAVRGGGSRYRTGDPYLRGCSRIKPWKARAECAVSRGCFSCEDQIKEESLFEVTLGAVRLWVKVSPKGIRFSNCTSQREEPYTPSLRASLLGSY